MLDVLPKSFLSDLYARLGALRFRNFAVAGSQIEGSNRGMAVESPLWFNHYCYHRSLSYEIDPNTELEIRRNRH